MPPLRAHRRLAPPHDPASVQRLHLGCGCAPLPSLLHHNTPTPPTRHSLHLDCRIAPLPPPLRRLLPPSPPSLQRLHLPCCRIPALSAHRDVPFLPLLLLHQRNNSRSVLHMIIAMERCGHRILYKVVSAQHITDRIATGHHIWRHCRSFRQCSGAPSPLPPTRHRLHFGRRTVPALRSHGFWAVHH